MSLKLEHLSSLSDPSYLRHRRGCHKLVAAKIDTHLETLKTRSSLILDLDDLLSKHKQLEEAISSYETIQSRLEVVEGPDESQRHAASVGTPCSRLKSPWRRRSTMSTSPMTLIVWWKTSLTLWIALHWVPHLHSKESRI